MVQKQNYLVWVIIACIIPDLPWIILKILITIDIFNPYDLRLYCTAQASLFFCLFLSGALACITAQPLRVFLVLAGNCLLHLLLDALQIKWGNGVHLLSPLTWEMFHIDLAWPEQFAAAGCTFFGFAYLIANWKGCISSGLKLKFSSKLKNICGSLLLAFYLAGPFIFLNQLEQADTYYIQTMRDTNLRPGRFIEFDRIHFYAEKKMLKTFAGEHIAVTGPQPSKSGRVSFRGHFLTPNMITADSYHYHTDFRDLASFLGLFLACTLLLQSLILPQIKARQNKDL